MLIQSAERSYYYLSFNSKHVPPSFLLQMTAQGHCLGLSHDLSVQRRNSITSEAS